MGKEKLVCVFIIPDIEVNIQLKSGQRKVRNFSPYNHISIVNFGRVI